MPDCEKATGLFGDAGMAQASFDRLQLVIESDASEGAPSEGGAGMDQGTGDSLSTPPRHSGIPHDEGGGMLRGAAAVREQVEGGASPTSLKSNDRMPSLPIISRLSSHSSRTGETRHVGPTNHIKPTPPPPPLSEQALCRQPAGYCW